jgi:hypothetical protein
MSSPPVVDMKPGAKFSFDMPDWVKLLIAECLIAFGRVEQKTIEIVWVVENADAAKKVKVARAPAADNFKKAITARNGITDTQRENYHKYFADLANVRNLIAHGSWLMVDGVPWVVWHKFIVDDGSVVGEFYERERFEATKRQCNSMLRMLSEVHLEAEKASGVKTNAIGPLGPGEV